MSNTDTKLSSLSIIIPARNEAYRLGDTLQRLLDLKYPKLEIVVLSDQSQDNTSEVVKGFAQKGVRFIEGKQPPSSWSGRNYAISQLIDQASGRFVMILDADSIVTDLTINSLVNQLDELKANSFLVMQGHNAYKNYVTQVIFQAWPLLREPLNRKVYTLIASQQALLKIINDIQLRPGAEPITLSTNFNYWLHYLIQDESKGYSYLAEINHEYSYFQHYSIRKGFYYLIRNNFAALNYSSKQSTIMAAWQLIVGLCYLGLLTVIISGSYYLIPLLILLLSYDAVHIIKINFCDGVFALHKKLARCTLMLLLSPASHLLSSAICYKSMNDYKSNQIDWRGRSLKTPSSL